jgi:hypothetical protein
MWQGIGIFRHSSERLIRDQTPPKTGGRVIKKMSTSHGSGKTADGVDGTSPWLSAGTGVFVATGVGDAIGVSVAVAVSITAGEGVGVAIGVAV